MVDYVPDDGFTPSAKRNTFTYGERREYHCYSADLSYIYHQGSEPWCWACATASTVGSRLAIVRQSPLRRFSAQDLINCCRPFAKCSYAWTLPQAFDYIMYNQICRLVDVPFTGHKGNCLPREKNQDERAIDLYAYFFALSPSVNLIHGILEHGPAVISFDVPEDFGSVGCILKYGKFSIYKGVGDEISRSSHAVSLVGDGDDFETDESFWVYKNSYGPRWGMNGLGLLSKEVEITEVAVPLYNHEDDHAFISEVINLYPYDDGRIIYQEEPLDDPMVLGWKASQP